MTAKGLQEIYDRNMAFFEENMPSISTAIRRHGKLTHCLIEGYENGELDLIVNGKSYYRKHAQQYAEKEVKEFTHQLRESAPLKTIQPPYSGSYEGVRFYFKHISDTVKILNREIPIPQDKYLLEDWYPIVIVTGCGLGLHVSELIDQKDINSLFVVEKDIEQFICSCYVTPWYEIAAKFSHLNGKSFHLILPITAEDYFDVFVSIWNIITKYAPRFPLTSLFYNHRRDVFYNDVVEKFHEEFHVFLTCWGNYDDEINQINHGLHNLREKTSFIPQMNKDETLSEDIINTPVVVVGGGPSVDERIEWIKSVRNKIFLISSGSSLRTLAHYEVIPDLHAELESDYNTASMYEFIGKDITSQIPIIGPIQLSPISFQYFSDARMFFKDSSSQITPFHRKGAAILPHATPTCSNTAVAIALYYGFKNVYFLGLDLSYKDAKKTHAEGSMYFDENAPEEVKIAMKLKENDQRLQTKNIKGEDVLTEAIYFSTQRRIENGIREFKDRTNVYNLSLGVNIEGTSVVDSFEEFSRLLEQGRANKEQVLNQLFNSNNVTLTEDDIQTGLNELYNFIHNFVDFTKKILDKMEPTSKSFDKAIFVILQFLEGQLARDQNMLYYFIRGTYWHYFYVGYGHCFTLPPNSELRVKSIEIWKKRFVDFLDKMEQHMKIVTQRNLSIEKDDWLYTTIHESVWEPDL